MRLLLIVATGLQDDKLTIGTPSSPSISNTVMYDFDRLILQANTLLTHGMLDDLYFSTNHSKTPASKNLYILNQYSSPRLDINEAQN